MPLHLSHALSNHLFQCVLVVQVIAIAVTIFFVQQVVLPLMNGKNHLLKSHKIYEVVSEIHQFDHYSAQ